MEEMKPMNSSYQLEGSADFELKLYDKKIQTSVANEINQVHKHESHDSHIAPVAWIIVVSESLHNFIDGLSIGAAFSESPIKGICLSIAIICEEFPHKLGDFAILLSAGMKFKVALLTNFLSSCFIYIGLVCGIKLGENLNANQWIYAIASGMFVYISICAMIPELNEMAQEIEDEDKKNSKSLKGNGGEKFPYKLKIRNMIIQHCGMLFGFGCMLLLALFSKKITL